MKAKNEKNRKVSRSCVKRLALYFHLLENMRGQGIDHVSCTRIAQEFDYEPILVRKDLEVTGVVGKARVGFKTVSLLKSIRKLLGWDKRHKAILVGTGNLGKAILGYKNFSRYGLQIVACFDADPGVVGKKSFGFKVCPLSRMSGLIKKHQVKVGIVTVPAEGAQSVVDKMVACGIKAIWNFAPAPLRIPEKTILENVRLTQSLAVLTKLMTKSV